MHPLTDVHTLARSLAARSAQPARRPAVLDVRWRLGGPPGAESYRAGHLPGAVFIDLDRELCGPPGRAGRHPLPPAAAVQDLMRHAGVSGGRTVVVYDDGDACPASRAWWTLRYFGHAAVQVLDGGYRAWTAAGYPVERGDGGGHAVPPGDFTAVPGGMPMLDASGAARLARRGVLLDARAAERYRGEVEPVDPVAGHIPGALSAPAAANVGRGGLFASPADLRARFIALGAKAGPGRGAAAGGDAGHGNVADAGTTAASRVRAAGAGPGPGPGESGSGGGSACSGGGAVGAGADGAPAVGVYCGSGVVAAQEVLALSLAGFPAALYIGSWSEWITDPARPVAAGPDPG